MTKGTALYNTQHHLLFIKWLQQHLLPCPFKFLTGIDCPGCGFQRSIIALLNGNLSLSLQLYPAAIPILVVWAYAIASRFVKLDTSKRVVFKTLCMVVGFIIIISYCVKMWHLYNYSKVVSA